MARSQASEQSRGSPLEGVVLALLANSRDPIHGYLLATLAERQLGPEWDVTRQAVYWALERLAKEGKIVELTGGASEERNRSRRNYAAGKYTEQALAEWLGSPLWPGPMRPELQARIAVSREKDAPALLRALDASERRCLLRVGETETTEVPMHSWSALTQNVARRVVDRGLRAELESISEARKWIEGFLAQDHSQASQ